MEAQTLQGEKVLIIGGGSGMRLETARLAAASGAKVVISGRTPSKLGQAATSVENDVDMYPRLC